MMNKYILWIFIFSLKIFGQNNLIIFTENAEPIQIEYNHQLYPQLAQSDIKLTQITENPVRIKIIFSNKNIASIDTALYLYHPAKPLQNQDIIYVIQKDNQTIKYLATLPSSDIKPVIPEIDTSIQVKTKEEKSIQKIIFLNDSNSMCLDYIDTSDFNKVIRHIDNIVNLDSKIILIEHFIKHNCFNQIQAQSIIERIPFEVEKLKIIKLLIPKLNDVFNLWNWKEYLKLTTAKESYTEHYQKYLYSLKNKPTINDSILQIFSQKISLLDNDANIVQTLKIIFSHYSVNILQVEKLISYLRHDQYKEEILKCTFYSLQNKKDFEKAINIVNFKETKERLKNFYEQQK